MPAPLFKQNARSIWNDNAVCESSEVPAFAWIEDSFAVSRDRGSAALVDFCRSHPALKRCEGTALAAKGLFSFEEYEKLT